MELYNYKATVVRVVDGDTVKLKIDLGFCVEWVSNCRMAGINAPEMSTDRGPISKDALTKLLPIGAEVSIKSTRLDKYGRPVVIIYLDGIDINAKMMADGYAVKYIN